MAKICQIASMRYHKFNIMLQIKNLTVKYKNKIGIQNLNLKAQSGEIIGFIGADGAGKSSSLNAIAGVLKFDGEIIYKNFKYTCPKEALKVKQNIGYMPQGIWLVLYDTLTIDEHLDFFANIRGIKQNKELLEYKKHLLYMADMATLIIWITSSLIMVLNL